MLAPNRLMDRNMIRPYFNLRQRFVLHFYSSMRNIIPLRTYSIKGQTCIQQTSLTHEENIYPVGRLGINVMGVLL